MPKKSKLYGWQCSECDKGSSSEEEIMEITEGQGQRKKRLAAAKALAASQHNSDAENDFWEQQITPQVLPKEPMNRNDNAEDVSHPHDNDVEILKENLIASTSSKTIDKEERRRKRKLEKKERKKKRKEMKKKRKEQEKAAAADENESDDCEIIEENGQVIVNIKPKPIKLKIKTPTEVNHLNNGKVKDQRTHCDACDSNGENGNLVRCDECQRCFHFWCLDPPVKKSPKVAGYGWNCKDCSPSDVDSDWHLD